jgi:hypothetical protein
LKAEKSSTNYYLMSRSYDWHIYQQLEPDASRHFFRSGAVSHYSENRADIARCRAKAAEDQEREEAYQACIERQRTGSNYNEDHLNDIQ